MAEGEPEVQAEQKTKEEQQKEERAEEYRKAQEAQARCYAVAAKVEAEGQAKVAKLEAERVEERRKRQEAVAWVLKQCNRTRGKDSSLQMVLLQWRLQVKSQRQPDSNEEQKEETPYDAILMFTSLSSFVENKKLDILQSVKSKLDISSSSELRIVAVVGLFDKGKTFSINMLFGKSLPSSKLCSTQGLSFIYVPERKMLVVDTAGIQSTVSYRPEHVEPIVDAQTTETFLFEWISRKSDMLIFVVNDFTWVEQRYVAMFHQKDRVHTRHRELIVLHNLKTTTNVKEAEALFEKQIVSCYKGAESHLADLVYTADLSPPIHHITICKEGSAAGRRYNKKNAEYAMNLLEFGQGGRAPVVLTDLLATGISELAPKFLLIEGETWKVEFELPVTTSEQKTPTPDGYMHAGMIAAKNSKLTMKTHGVIGEFGEVVAFNASFNPEFNIYEEHKEHEIVRTIQIECPSIDTNDFDVEQVESGVQVVIERSKTIDEARVVPVTPIIERHGRFEKVFEVPDWTFRLCDEETSLANGILKIFLRKPVRAGKKTKLKKNAGPATVPSCEVEKEQSLQGSLSHADGLSWQHADMTHKSVSEAGSTIGSSWQHADMTHKSVSEAGSTIHRDATSVPMDPPQFPQTTCIPASSSVLTPGGHRPVGELQASDAASAIEMPVGPATVPSCEVEKEWSLQGSPSHACESSSQQADMHKSVSEAVLTILQDDTSVSTHPPQFPQTASEAASEAVFTILQDDTSVPMCPPQLPQTACIPASSSVLTPDGHRPAGELQASDAASVIEMPGSGSGNASSPNVRRVPTKDVHAVKAAIKSAVSHRGAQSP